MDILECRRQVQMKAVNDSTICMLCSINEFETPDYLVLTKSTDFGHSWTKVSMIYTFSTYADFHYIDDTTIILAIKGYIVKSKDGGNSFYTVMESEYPNDWLQYYAETISFSNRDTGYVAYRSRIYRTTNGGETWTMSQLVFNQPNLISFVKATSGTKLIVGTWSGQLYKTEDAGNTWVTTALQSLNESKLKLYPNPTNSTLTIQTDVAWQEATATLTNLEGRVVFSQALTNNQQQSLDIGHLPNGMYFVTVQSEQQKWVRRVVKAE
jgi:hypothetical protein